MLLLNLALSQARGEPQEAAREVRTLRDLMREIEAAVQKWAAACQELLEVASKHLKILDPEVGEEELIQVLAAEVANLPAFSVI